MKYFAILSLLVGLSGYSPKPDLDGFREVKISNSMLDTIPESRLNSYEETTEKTYLLSCLVLSTADSSSKSSPARLEEWKESLSIPDTIRPIYGERLWDFALYPQITYEVEPRYLGAYQRRRTIIKGIGFDIITEKEEEYIKSRQE